MMLLRLKYALIAALMPKPRLVVLDEPVAGMTDEETERTAELFCDIVNRWKECGGWQPRFSE